MTEQQEHASPLGDRLIHHRVKQTRLRTYENSAGETVESQTGVYGGRLNTDEQGHLVFDMRKFPNVIGGIDQIGDGRFRRTDDNIPESLSKIAKRGAREFFNALKPTEGRKLPDVKQAAHAVYRANKFLSPGLIEHNSKRYRGTPEEIAANAKRLGLEEYYGLHPWGVEIKKPEVYRDSVSLHDIFRADQIDSPILNKIDRLEALDTAVAYLRDMHIRYGAIGEVLLADFLFQNINKDKRTVSNPVLAMPDIVPNGKTLNTETGRRATDVLDLMVCAATQEYRRSHDWENVKKTMDIIVEGYGDISVLRAAKSFMKRGRVVMEGDEVKGNMFKEAAGRLHNNIRLGVSEIPKEERSKLRTIVTNEISTYL